MVLAAMKAPDLEMDVENHKYIQPVGMSDRDFTIARHALESSRNAPVYLMEAFRMQEVAVKLAAGLGVDASPKLVQHVVHVVEARQYERVKVKAIDVEATVVEEKDG